MGLVSAFSMVALCLCVGMVAVIALLTGDAVYRFGAKLSFATACLFLACIYVAFVPGEYPLYQHPIEFPFAALILCFLSVTTMRSWRFFRFGKLADPITDLTHQLHNTLDFLPVQAAFITPDMRYGFANKAYCEVLGKYPSQVIGEKLSSLIAADIFNHIRPRLEQALAGRQVTWQFDFSRPEWLREKGAATYLPIFGHGQVIGVLVVVMDQSELQAAEFEAELNEAKRALAAEVAGVGYLEWDVSGNLVDVSHEVEELFDGEIECLRSLWHKFEVNEDSRDEQIVPDEHTHPLPAEHIENVRIQTSDARRVDLRVCLRRLTTSKGGRLLAAIQDVTNQQQVLTELVESGDRFRDFTESATDWVWEMDTESRFTFLSGGSRNTQNDSVLFELGKTIEESKLNTVSGEYALLCARMSMRETFRNLRLILSQTNGGVYHLDMSGKPIYDRQGNFAGYRGTTFDVTEIVSAKVARQGAQEALALAFEKISTIVALFDSEDRVVYCNEEYRAMYLDPKMGNVVGHKFDDLVDHFIDTSRLKGGSEGQARWARARKNRREQPAKFFRAQLADGRWVEVTDYFVADGSLLTIAADITEKVEREERLHAHEAALQLLNRRETLGQMTASIAHELNQPLAAIHNYAAGCVLRAKNDQLKRDDMITVLTNMMSQSERASAILRSMSTYLHSGDAERSDVPIEEILTSVGLLIQPEISMKKIEVEFNDHTNGIVLNCAKIEIEQLLINLIKNGIEACAEAGRANATVRVTARTTVHNVVIDVADDGPGFDPDITNETAFYAFRSTKDKGLGVGLAICEAIVNSHGGTIDISQSDKSGACLTVKLPMSGQEHHARN